MSDAIIIHGANPVGLEDFLAGTKGKNTVFNVHFAISLKN